MDKIKRISLFFRVLFQISFIALPLCMIAAWLTSNGTLVLLGGAIKINYIPLGYSGRIFHTLSTAEKWRALTVSTLPLLIQMYILFSLIQLFKLYEKGEIFSSKNVRYIRNIGIALLVTQIIEPFYQAIMGLVLTWYNGAGNRFIAIGVERKNIAVILIALIVILISWIMSEGCKLREEQQFTV